MILEVVSKLRSQQEESNPPCIIAAEPRLPRPTNRNLRKVYPAYDTGPHTTPPAKPT